MSEQSEPICDACRVKRGLPVKGDDGLLRDICEDCRQEFANYAFTAAQERAMRRPLLGGVKTIPWDNPGKPTPLKDFPPFAVDKRTT